MSVRALILFGHGARDPEWAQPLERVRALTRAARPDLHVELAFLEFMAPGLAQRVGELHAAGIREITVLPMFIAQGGHLKREVPELLAALRREHPAATLRLAPPIGETAGVIAAMAAAAADAAGAR